MEIGKRLDEKIELIERYLDEIESVLPVSLEEYKADFKIQAIFERYFERIIETVIDVSFYVVKLKGFRIPENEKNVFDVLNDEEIIDDVLRVRLKEAKGMRNIIAHQYGDLDIEMVYDSIVNELLVDARKFVGLVIQKL